MKYIYIDESGISKAEPVLVVAGVVVDADTQWMSVAEHLTGLVEKYVAEEDRDGFIFHATELFSRKGKVFGQRDKYSIDHCQKALAELVHTPARLRLGVVYGFVYKRPPRNFLPKFASEGARLEASINHSFGFSLCIVAVEHFMETNSATSREVATLVAENNTNTRDAVKDAARVLKGHNLTTERELKQLQLLNEIARGRVPVHRIVDTVHFVEKQEAPLVQIADACALIIRYAIQGREDAQPLVRVFTQGNPEALIVDRQTELKSAGWNVLAFSAPTEVAPE